MLVAVLAISCSNKNNFDMGSYGYDARFLKENGISYSELISEDGNSKVLVVPAWQGRVMTSSAAGDGGDSFGWMNYEYISKGEIDPQFSPFGGEERLWLGPEGGPFSLYFKGGDEQVFANWQVPKVLDTEAFDVDSSCSRKICLSKEARLTNASGTEFKMRISRTVSLMDKADVEKSFRVRLPKEIQMVGYESRNCITNAGAKAWSKDEGLIDVWMLGCFNPTPTTTVFIPYNEYLDCSSVDEPASESGRIVNDEYFGKMPEGRLVAEDGIVYFKIDGALRSKIGLNALRSKGLCGSYDSSRGLLTILWCGAPPEGATYVNGQWGHQDDPFNGDVINSYNDGPLEDGSIMGPFYEIETSSPGAELQAGETLAHVQKVMHIQGDEKNLAPIVKAVFGADIQRIKDIFKNS